MRALYIIAISLCFLVLRWHNYTYAKTHHNKNTYSPARLSDTFLGCNLTEDQGHLLITGAELGKSPNFTIDAEDDDDYGFARKNLFSTKYYPLLSYALVFGLIFSLLKRPLPVPGLILGTSACLYLKQRVLRI